MPELAAMKILIAVFWVFVNTFTHLFFNQKFIALKKFFVSISLLALLVACGGESGESKEGETAATPAEAPAVEDVTQNPDYKAGLALIGKSDCLTCHKTTEKVVGPAYVDVAKKYAGVDTAIAYLSHKIIAGGTGVWGTVPMSAHPNVSQADAEQMVKYILLLKDAQ